mmetsp:Transcript_601/g.1618  ORF Transcript_601/g.1618 Transcript_601/m.1618 type:complete len:88 (+) Transcript_601:94-357(+)
MRLRYLLSGFIVHDKLTLTASATNMQLNAGVTKIKASLESYRWCQEKGELFLRLGDALRTHVHLRTHLPTQPPLITFSGALTSSTMA